MLNKLNAVFLLSEWLELQDYKIDCHLWEKIWTQFDIFSGFYMHHTFCLIKFWDLISTWVFTMVHTLTTFGMCLLSVLAKRVMACISSNSWCIAFALLGNRVLPRVPADRFQTPRSCLGTTIVPFYTKIIVHTTGPVHRSFKAISMNSAKAWSVILAMWDFP